MKYLLVAAGAVLMVGLVFWVGRQPEAPAVEPGKTEEMAAKGVKFDFGMPKKSAHYESNTPKHGVVLAGVPINVVVDVNFDLAGPSEIKIEKDGRDFGIGETEIDGNKLAMRRKMSSVAEEGKYTVQYKACWPDKSCHAGNFEFGIDKSMVSEFTDMRGQQEVGVDLREVAFAPMKLRIARGTKVVWTNSDEVEHYVNTDSHPAHTYFKEQNSKVLKKGDKYELVFAEPGVYLYHCSAHAEAMVGEIVVE